MRTATYSRVSTARDQSPEAQVAELGAYCTARGWSVVEEIVDHGFSGGSDQRPGLKRLLELVRARQVDAVVVVKLDRLFRSLKHLVNTLAEFDALGVKFIATRDQVDLTTPAGRMFAQILGSLAEFERALIRERTMAGLAHARAKGKRFGRPQRHNPDEIRRLRAEGLSYREIERRLGAPAGCVARALAPARKTQSENVKAGSGKSGGCLG